MNLSTVRKISLAAAGAAAVMAAGATSAQAAYSCGDNYRTVYVNGNGYTQLIYRNCSSSSVRRKMDVSNGIDGSCKTIYRSGQVGDTIILGEISQVGIQRIRGSKAC